MQGPQEIKLSYKAMSLENLPKITSSLCCKELLYQTWDQDTIGLHETFKVLFLNNSNKVLGIMNHSTGGITGTVADIRIIMAAALKSLSVAFILAHNHPSGTLRPSQADISLTKRIKQAAEYFDIKVLDHLIFSPNGSYYSFADEGCL